MTPEPGAIALRYGLLATCPKGAATADAPLEAWLECARAIGLAAPLLERGERVILSHPERLGQTVQGLCRALADLTQHAALKGLEPGQIAFRLDLPHPGPAFVADVLTAKGVCLVPSTQFDDGTLSVRQAPREPPQTLRAPLD